tara:strand:- start:823 stop:1239 length:417 start_codon:yes stop_codon:yes gene_type:complete
VILTMTDSSKDEELNDYDKAIMKAWKQVLDAYATHMGDPQNMTVIMVRDPITLQGKVQQMFEDMKAANGRPCTKYPEREVYDVDDNAGMHLIFPHHNMHYFFPDVPEKSEGREDYFRVRAYGNRLAIEEIINANMKKL